MKDSFSGILRKMKIENSSPANYYLSLSNNLHSINSFIGKNIIISSNGKIHCIACNREIKKSFQQGYCFPCFKRTAACDICIIKPELCHYHLGTCREPSWGVTHCLKPHVVYLANTGQLKVGITRKSQIPTRWLDQGSCESVVIASVNTRLQSGLVEESLKQILSDKTNWRLMLSPPKENLDIIVAAQNCQNFLMDNLSILYNELFKQEDIKLEEIFVNKFSYPVTEYPKKISTINLEKQNQFQGRFLGIKGQYLLTDIGAFNCRKYAGYVVSFTFSD